MWCPFSALFVWTTIVCCIIARQVPLDKAFQLHEIPLKGIGAIASRDIAIGELLIEEPALFSLQNHNSWFAPSESYSAARAESAVDKLSAEDQQRFYALHGYDSSGNYSEGGDGRSSRSAIHIYRTNAYPMGSGRSGMFPLISRLNSACIPNVHYNYDEDRCVSTVHAIHPISAGEEIVNCYLGLFLTRAERIAYYRRNFGFSCSCQCCSLTGTEQLDSDARRQSLASLVTHTRRAILEGRVGVALDAISERIDLLRKERLLSPATLFRCEVDAFHAIVIGSYINRDKTTGSGAMDVNAAGSSEASMIGDGRLSREIESTFQSGAVDDWSGDFFPVSADTDSQRPG
jgi:SET domain